MTDRGQQGSPNSDPKVAPETLELRARPQPVTRINRKVVIGAAAVLLCLISFIVLLALKPPSLRVAGPQELFNVEHKPVTDALSKLPASYDGIRPDKKTDPAKQPAYFLVFDEDQVRGRHGDALAPDAPLEERLDRGHLHWQAAVRRARRP
jgi:type IV secretion system protein VirB10